MILLLAISCHISCHNTPKKVILFVTRMHFYHSILKLPKSKKPVFSTFVRNCAENTDFLKKCGRQESNLH